MRRFTLFLLLVLVSCGSDDSPSGPGTVESLARFELSFDAAVVEGTPVGLTITAVGNDGSSPFPGFAGDVELAVTSGSITPSSVVVSGGQGSTQVTLSGATGNVQVSITGQQVTSSAQVNVAAAASNGTIEFSTGRYLVSVQAGANSETQNPHTIADPIASPSFGATHQIEVADPNPDRTAEASADATMSATFAIQEDIGSLHLAASGDSSCNGIKDDSNWSVHASGATHIELEFFVHTGPLSFQATGSITAAGTEFSGDSAVIVLRRTFPDAESKVVFRNEGFTAAGTLEPGQYLLTVRSESFTAMSPPGTAAASAQFSIEFRVFR